MKTGRDRVSRSRLVDRLRGGQPITAWAVPEQLRARDYGPSSVATVAGLYSDQLGSCCSSFRGSATTGSSFAINPCGGARSHYGPSELRLCVRAYRRSDRGIFSLVGTCRTVDSFARITWGTSLSLLATPLKSQAKKKETGGWGPCMVSLATFLPTLSILCNGGNLTVIPSLRGQYHSTGRRKGRNCVVYPL